MSVAIDVLIVFGKDHYDSVAIGSTIGLVAFSLMLVVAALECRDQTATVLREETLNNNTVNLAIVAEVVLALLIGRGGALTSLLGTQPLTGTAVADRRSSCPDAVHAVGARQGDRASPLREHAGGGAHRRDGGDSDVS